MQEKKFDEVWHYEIMRFGKSRNLYKLLFVCVNRMANFSAKKGSRGFQGTGSGSDVHTGTEAWNIAQYFTGFSIAR